MRCSLPGISERSTRIFFLAVEKTADDLIGKSVYVIIVYRNSGSSITGDLISTSVNRVYARGKPAILNRSLYGSGKHRRPRGRLLVLSRESQRRSLARSLFGLALPRSCAGRSDIPSLITLVGERRRL